MAEPSKDFRSPVGERRGRGAVRLPRDAAANGYLRMVETYGYSRKADTRIRYLVGLL